VSRIDTLARNEITLSNQNTCQRGLDQGSGDVTPPDVVLRAPLESRGRDETMDDTEHLDEKAFNQALAGILKRHNRVAVIDAEKAGKLAAESTHRRAQPDITVEHPGRESVLIENKYDNTREQLLNNQCEKRLDARWSNGSDVRVVVGLRTPIRMAAAVDVTAEIQAASDFCWAAWTSGGGRLPSTGWINGTISEFVGFLSRVGVDAVDTEDLTNKVKRALSAASKQIVAGDSAAAGFGEVLLQAPGEQTNRMAMAVMFNAVVFQAHIANHHNEVSSPAQMLGAKQATQLQVMQQWQTILDINYWPIFGVSRELLSSISDQTLADKVLGLLFDAAVGVASAPASQGLIGRIFGELIGDRKFLATFYTLPSSAALLADLAAERLDVDWSNSDAVTSLRVGDMACGTGALLTAAYARISERHLLNGGDPKNIHRVIMEEVMTGCDVVPAAVHLTAARLSGEHPNVDYTSTKTWVMPYGSVPDIAGYPVIKLGALDLQHVANTQAQWGDGTIAASAVGEVRQATAQVGAGSLDLVIMNPPFTRPTNHEAHHEDIPNPSFAGMGNDDAAQKAMSKALKSIVSKIAEPKASNGNAGLASNFVDLAHAKLKPGGVLALVLPAIAISGDSWRKARQLIKENYQDITVLSISSQGSPTTDRAFSVDTSISEVLLVAKKREEPQAADTSEDSTIVVLQDRPSSVAWGVEIARAIRNEQDGSLTVGKDEIGWTVTTKFGSDAGHPSGIAEPDVAIAARSLTEGSLKLPRITAHELPTVPIGLLGHTGPIDRDINGVERKKVKSKVVKKSRGPFTVAELKNRKIYRRVSYPVLWSHDAASESKMEVLPSSKGRIRGGMSEQALRVWEGGYVTKTKDSRVVAGATRLHLNRDFRVTSQPLGACLTPVPALGGRAWPTFSVNPSDGGDPLLWEKALCVWMNTTPGLIARWWVSSRQQQGRANLTITTLGTIPVIDLRELPQQQVRLLADAYDAFCGRELLPANQADGDPVRHELDEQVLCHALGLPTSVLDPLSTLRHQWCNEPSNL